MYFLNYIQMMTFQYIYIILSNHIKIHPLQLFILKNHIKVQFVYIFANIIT